MIPKPLSIFSLIKIFGIFIATLGLSAEKPHLVIEGSESPNGRYAVAWGIPYTMLDDSDLGNVDFDAVENFLVDLKSGEQIATLNTTFFEGKNHGGLSSLWRKDSGALMIVEGGKWGAISASVIYIVEPEREYDQCSDVMPVTQGIRRAVKGELSKINAKHAEAIQNFEISMLPLKWTGENRVKLEIVGQVPKGDDSFFYEGEMDVNLPSANSVSIGGEAQGAPAPNVPDGGNGDLDTLITANSVGPIKLGMTIAQARASAPGTVFERRSDGEGIALISVTESGEELMTIYAGEENPDSKIDEKAQIIFMEVWSPLLKTAEGISTGMSISQAEKSIGDLREIFMSEIESREFASFTDQPSGLTFRVTHDRGSAGKYRGNTTTTSRYTPGASILSIEVSGSDIMQDGSIAGIKIGSTEAEVLAISENEGMGNPFKGKDEIWEAFGQAVQTWLFPDAGISVDMISDEIGGPKSVYSITAKAGSKFVTGKGISMGAKKTEVIKAYSDYKTETEEMELFGGEEDVHLVGSIYGGMIFTFEKGELSQIFLGAAAE